MTTVVVTISVSKDFPAPNGQASIQFSGVPEDTYTITVTGSAGNVIGTQQLATQSTADTAQAEPVATP